MDKKETKTVLQVYEVARDVAVLSQKTRSLEARMSQVEDDIRDMRANMNRNHGFMSALIILTPMLLQYLG